MNVNKRLPEKVNRIAEYVSGINKTKIRLDANESFVKLTPGLMQKVAEAVLSVEFNRYPAPRAYELCRAYGDYIGIPVECIAAGNGSDELLQVLISAFLEKGQKLLVCPPDFSMYDFYASISEVETVRILRDGDFLPDFEKVRNTVEKENISMVVFSNPCNPTGSVATRNAVLDFVTSTRAIVVVDEAYMDFGEESVADMAKELDNLIVLRTMSKAMGLAALRIGVAISNQSFVDGILKSKSTFNINALSQAIGKTVLEDKDFIVYANRAVKQSSNSLYNGLAILAKGGAFKVYPAKSTNFVLTEWEDSGYIYGRLMEKDISVRKIGRYLRISAGDERENEALIAALGEIANERH